MKNPKFNLFTVISLLSIVLLSVVLSGAASADYLKMNPPPDVDKGEHQHGNLPTCWVAAGSNLLAGAGYGDGNNVQERADDVYMELCNHLVDCNQCGWDDTAINKWLLSNFNTWKNTNPYNSVVVRGNRNPRPPYKITNLPEVIGDNLRKCDYLSLSIRRPTSDSSVGTGGHSVACWGDTGADVNDINVNPTKVKISDSDYLDISKAVQTYTYDDYNNPNPGDCNEGVGWYFNYWNKPHWYIDGYVLLQATEGNTPATRTLVASDKFTYNGNDPCALDLHYRISSNKQILSYRTSINWDTNHAPTFWEDTNWVNVSWDLNDNPVPKGSIITATAEIVVPYDANGNTISINQVFWTPMYFVPSPGMWGWGRHNELPGGQSLYAPNMCGGYVVCAFMVFADTMGAMPVGEYRYQFDYDYYQNPEQHTITFQPEGTGTYFMGFFRFGHSYGLLTDEELDAFYDWKNVENPGPPFPLLAPRTFVLNWAGQLPYPQGQDLINPEPNECGDPGTWYVSGDINKDCKVDWQDFSDLAATWLVCTDPNQDDCP